MCCLFFLKRRILFLKPLLGVPPACVVRPRPLGPLLLLLAVSLVLAACREGPSLYDPPDRNEPPAGSLWRLTFGVEDARSPAWTPDGSAIVFSVPGGVDLPPSAGVIARIPQGGGVAEPALPALQLPEGPERWFVAPAFARDGGTLHFAEIVSLYPPDPCSHAFRSCNPDLPFLPIRIEDIAIADVPTNSAGEPTATDRRTVLRIAGRRNVAGPTSPTPEFEVRNYPFQQLFEGEGVFVFRPSPSPGGDRVAFSDGLRILIREPATERIEPVPGTEDGVSVAWSPDGEWLAFEVLEPGDSTGIHCMYFPPSGGFPTCQELRTEFEIARRALVIVRPDGSDRREVGTGAEPAWAADGSGLYVRRGGSIWFVPVQGAPPQPVGGTAGGREPAVSPDGTRLAFVRRNPDAQPGTDPAYALWVLDLTRAAQ